MEHSSNHPYSTCAYRPTRRTHANMVYRRHDQTKPILYSIPIRHTENDEANDQRNDVQMTPELWSILITAVVGAISGVSAAVISWLNRKDMQAQAANITKSNNPIS